MGSRAVQAINFARWQCWYRCRDICCRAPAKRQNRCLYHSDGTPTPSE